MKKSTTQMTKQELLEVIRNKDTLIAELNDRVDDLESMSIASAAKPIDADSSRMMTLMNQRIKKLEERISEICDDK